MRPKRHKPGEQMEPVEVYARIKAIPEYDERNFLKFSIFRNFWKIFKSSFSTKSGYIRFGGWS